MRFDHEPIERAAGFLRDRSTVAPEIAVVLGSGLGAFADRLTDAGAVAYADIPGWPCSPLVGHGSRLVLGMLAGRRVAALDGRVHLYQGFDARAVAFGVRVIATLGARDVILTNAAGGISTRFARGALMLIDDHINLTGANPLVGPNDARLGPRFPDMTEVYSGRLRRLATQAARDRGLALEHGVYAALLGPSYETPAEIRFLRTIGADAVGMSTALEALALRHMGREVLGVSCITNMAAGIEGRPLDHAEVLATTARVREGFESLLEGTIAAL